MMVREERGEREHPLELSTRENEANGLRYLRVGGRRFCLEAEKTRSQKNA